MTAIRHPTGFIARPDATLRRRVCRGTARAIEMTALLVIVSAVLGVAALGAIIGAVLAAAARIAR